MAKAKVISIEDNSKFVKSYGILDYKGISDVLKSGSSAFVFDTKETHLKPQTMWKAAKRLTVLVGKNVVAVKGKYDKEPGYSFMVVDEKV
jgi:hypothetical protein